MEFAVDFGSSLGSGKQTIVSAVVFCACVLVFFVVFYEHKFDFRLVISKTSNGDQWKVTETCV